MTSRTGSVEPHPYRDFEHAGWQAAGARYPASFAHATAAYVDPLLDAVGAVPGTRLLDVACGSGVVAAAGARRGATVEGVDFSSAMLAEARQRLPSIPLHQADAEALPLEAGRFDGVVCNFGLHHFPFPVRALAEARRVLRTGGRLACTVWAAPDVNRAWRIVFDAIAHYGDPAISLPTAPLGRLNRPEDLTRVAIEAGFDPAATVVRTVDAHWPLASAEDLLNGFLAGTVRMAALAAAQTADAQARIRTAIAAAVRSFPRDDGFAVPTAALLLTATA